MTAVRWLLLCLIVAAKAQDGEKSDQKPDVRLPPSIVGTPLQNNASQYYFEVSQKLTLYCRTLGQPTPQITWYVSKYVQAAKKFQQMDVDLNSDNKILTADGNLQFLTMYTIDQGYYHCEASNDYGRAMSLSVHIILAVLSRNPPPTTNTRSVKEGDPAILTCEQSKCFPPPSYNWNLALNPDEVATRNLALDKRLTISPQGDLYISHVKLEDARNGMLYKCMVKNSILDTTVGGSYRILKVTPVPGNLEKPPQLVYPLVKKTVIAILGDEFALKCIFKGNPAATISWAKKGAPLPQGRKSIIEFDSKLLIKDTHWSDEGEYTCTGDNGVGTDSYTIEVDVQSRPTFVKTIPGMLIDLNATEGEDAEFYCEADKLTEPAPEITFLSNASPIPDKHAGARKSIVEIGGDRYGKIFKIKSVCKDCTLGGTDLMGIQCRIENVNGIVFKSVYLNVLVGTTIKTAPEDLVLNPEVIKHGEVSFVCEAQTDHSTEAFIVWKRDDQIISMEIDRRITIDKQNTLHIDIKDLEKQGEEYVGTYTCVADNGYSQASVEAILSMPGGLVATVKEGGLADMWWIFVVIAVILLLLLLLLLCCLCIQRNKGDSYPVDEKERANGNDPEKELMDDGFHDYQRPEDEPMKGSRASLTSTIKLDTDDEGSLNEYGDIDTGKFNEDGSFIGQYMNDKKKKRAMDSSV